jgi:hypothetical protein
MLTSKLKQKKLNVILSKKNSASQALKSTSGIKTGTPLFLKQSAASHKDFLIQPKLTIGQPNDKYEKEADTVAEQVMSMPETAIQKKPT